MFEPMLPLDLPCAEGNFSQNGECPIAAQNAESRLKSTARSQLGKLSFSLNVPPDMMR
jgi:hypothetical protein